MVNGCTCIALTLDGSLSVLVFPISATAKN